MHKNSIVRCKELNPSQFTVSFVNHRDNFARNLKNVGRTLFYKLDFLVGRKIILPKFVLSSTVKF